MKFKGEGGEFAKLLRSLKVLNCKNDISFLTFFQSFLVFIFFLSRSQDEEIRKFNKGRIPMKFPKMFAIYGCLHTIIKIKQ